METQASEQRDMQQRESKSVVKAQPTHKAASKKKAMPNSDGNAKSASVQANALSEYTKLKESVPKMQEKLAADERRLVALGKEIADFLGIKPVRVEAKGKRGRKAGGATGSRGFRINKDGSDTHGLRMAREIHSKGALGLTSADLYKVVGDDNVHHQTLSGMIRKGMFAKDSDGWLSLTGKGAKAFQDANTKLSERKGA